MEFADFLDPADAVEGIEVARVLGGELCGFDIAAAEVRVGVGVRIRGGEEMEAEPAAIHAGDALGLAKECDEEEEDEVGIDEGLELEVAGKFLTLDFTGALLELEGGVQGVVDLLDEGDEGADVCVADAAARVIALELIDEPAGVVNTDVELIAGASKKGAGEFAQFAG